MPCNMKAGKETSLKLCRVVGHSKRVNSQHQPSLAVTPPTHPSLLPSKQLQRGVGVTAIVNPVIDTENKVGDWEQHGRGAVDPVGGHAGFGLVLVFLGGWFVFLALARRQQPLTARGGVAFRGEQSLGGILHVHQHDHVVLRFVFLLIKRRHAPASKFSTEFNLKSSMLTRSFLQPFSFRNKLYPT